MENNELEVITEQTVDDPSQEETPEASEDIQTEPASEEAQEEPAETAAEPAAEAPAPAKKSKLLLILAIVIVVLAAGGFLVYQNLPSTKAGKLIKQAQAYAEGKEYAQAVETLITARETDPENRYLKDAFSDVFHANAHDHMALDPPDYAKALEVYTTAESITPDYIEDLYAKEAEILKEWAALAALSDDMDLVKQHIERLAAAIERGLPGLGVTKSQLERQLSQLEADEAVNVFAALFSTAAEAGDINGMIGLFTDHIRNTESELFKKAVSKRGTRASSFPILSDAFGDKKLGIYYKNSEYFIYYGTYDSFGKRVGSGIWVTTRGERDSGSYRTYFYNGIWENDKPNGEVYLYLYTKYAAGNEETKYGNATVKDGLFNGSFTYTYAAIGDFDVTYENGDPVQIDTRIDSDGSEIKVYAYNYDHSKMISSLQMHDGVFGTY